MASQNVHDLETFIRSRKIGERLSIATSQYANNTTPPSFRFDFWSTAPAVRSLIKRGILEGRNGWRCYDVTVVKMPDGENLDRVVNVKMTIREARALALAAGDILDNEDARESVFVGDTVEENAARAVYDRIRIAGWKRA